MKVKLRVWRQGNSQTQGKFVEYIVEDVTEDMSFLEMLDKLNNELVHLNDEVFVVLVGYLSMDEHMVH